MWTLVSVLYTLTSQYQNQSQNYRRLSFLCNAHALLTNPLRCPDTNRIRLDGRIRFVYATCGRRYFCIRIKNLWIQKSPDTCGRGLNKVTKDLCLICICKQKTSSPVLWINSNQKDKALPVKTSTPNFVAFFVYCEISLFVTAANREGILLETYASLASLARRNWR